MEILAFGVQAFEQAHLHLCRSLLLIGEFGLADFMVCCHGGVNRHFFGDRMGRA